MTVGTDAPEPSRRQIRLVQDGETLGIKSIEEATWLAEQLGLELTELLTEEGDPPMYRLGPG